MKRISVLRILSLPGAVALLLGLAAPPKLAAEFECKQEHLAGTWVYIYPAEELSGQVPYRQTANGWARFDETGRLKPFVHNVLYGNDGKPFTYEPWTDVTQFLDIRSTMNPDCTVKIVFTDRSTGQVVQETSFVCAEGVRECWGLTGVPPVLGIVTMKKIDPPNAALEAKVDALSAKVDLLLQRLGIMVPKR